jgi:hypothetical protein
MRFFKRCAPQIRTLWVEIKYIPLGFKYAWLCESVMRLALANELTTHGWGSRRLSERFRRAMVCTYSSRWAILVAFRY